MVFSFLGWTTLSTLFTKFLKIYLVGVIHESSGQRERKGFPEKSFSENTLLQSTSTFATISQFIGFFVKRLQRPIILDCVMSQQVFPEWSLMI